MLFFLIKGYVRLALTIVCRRIVVDKPQWLAQKGPLLLACNHPNSFLDGIILTALFQQPVYSLARGDAFQQPFFNKVLRWLRLLPVYRTSEGAENLEHNYTTFEACKEVFRTGGIVIIFSEGRCINEWRLRPLRKGTARLATGCWEEGIDLTVLPIGLNYNSFRNFGKNVFIKIGEPLDRGAVMQHRTDGKMFLTFNDLLQAELEQLVFHIDPPAKADLAARVVVPLQPWKRVVLVLPALTGLLLHVPLYFPLKWLTKKYFDNDHFDSVLTSLLALIYPFFLAVWCGLALYFFNAVVALILLVFLPFSAWCIVQIKAQV